MALGKSIKMYLTIFVATTCIYMVLYQYHISRQPMPAEILRNKELSVDAEERVPPTKAADFVRRYNLFLWSPMAVLSSAQRQQEQKQQQNATQVATSPSPLSPPPQPPSSLKSSISSTSPIAKAKKQHQQEFSSSLESDFGNHSFKRQNHHQLQLRHQQHDNQILSKGNNFHDKNDVDATIAAQSNSSTAATSSTTTTIRTTTASVASSIHVVPSSIKSTNTSSSSSLASYPTTTTTVIKPTTTNTFNSKSSARRFVADVTPPPLYIITPTYRRPEQLAELTRLGYTLKHIANLLWLVIEDANKTSPLVTQTLNRIGVPFEYLVAPMPEEYKKTKKPKPRGVSNRNRGLQWLRENATEGVFYFADDDNTYDVSIFAQMRYTKKVSMWPVGLVTKFGVSSPIIRKGKIDGFYDGWVGGRKYAVDMAGFAVSVKFLHDRPAAKMPFKPGYEEDGFLKSLAPLNNTEIELLASECTEILTWHTQTKKNPPAERLNMTKYGDTNLVSINKVLVRP